MTSARRRLSWWRSVRCSTVNRRKDIIGRHKRRSRVIWCPRSESSSASCDNKHTDATNPKHSVLRGLLKFYSKENAESTHLSDVHHPAPIYKQKNVIDPFLHILRQSFQTPLPVLILDLEKETNCSIQLIQDTESWADRIREPYIVLRLFHLMGHLLCKLGLRWSGGFHRRTIHMLEPFIKCFMSFLQTNERLKNDMPWIEGQANFGHRTR